MLLKKPFTSTGVILTQPNTPQASELLNCLPPGILAVQPLTSLYPSHATSYLQVS